ncbi:MAG: cytochrome P450 [Rhodoferax sp.]|uniref:cytochrome P450 n=1 Tax=Rhodoferax sp. TaxID=50421 RepID=UPI003267D1D5
MNAATAIAPFVDAAFLANPYPAYQALREAGPLHWSTEFFGGAWLLTRHADVEQVLRDPRFSAQRTGGWVTDREETKGELAGFQQLFARAMLFLDAPDHTRIRKVLNAGFKPAQILALEPFIAQTVTELLDAVDGQPSFDFMQAVARQLPTRVIAKMMGIEEAANADFAVWSDDLAVFIGAPLATHQQARRAQASLLAMGRYFEQLLSERRKNPGDDLVSRLLQAEADGALLNHAELLAQCAMLLFAGHETTRNLLGNGLYALLSHPDQWQRLQQNPALIPSAVRELLRFDSPVQYTGRRVAADVELHGQTLRRGDLVVPLIGSANRDPARHAEPDRLDVEGRDGGSISFGSGAHVCIGAMLTRVEAEITFRLVLQRFPSLRLADKAVQWVDNPAYRGLVGLPVRAGLRYVEAEP